MQKRERKQVTVSYDDDNVIHCEGKQFESEDELFDWLRTQVGGIQELDITIKTKAIIKKNEEEDDVKE